MYLSGDNRNLFDLFELSRQDVVDIWKILMPVLSKFHRDSGKVFCSFCGLLQDCLLLKIFGGDITLTNILLAETRNPFLSF